jgi:rubrerythrin
MPEKYNFNGREFDSKENGVDYNIVYEYTCTECKHSWRMTMLIKNAQCPKCKSIKVYYMSKRSCDPEVAEEVNIPEDSELL